MFVILTQSSLEDAAADLTEFDLKQNILTAMTTASVLVGTLPLGQVEACIRFNVFLWRRHTLALIEYVNIMLERLDKVYQSATPFGTSSIRDEMIGLNAAIADDFTGEIIGMPAWTQMEAYVGAMRGYMVHLDPAYSQLFIEPPIPLPIPFATQWGIAYA